MSLSNPNLGHKRGLVRTHPGQEYGSMRKRMRRMKQYGLDITDEMGKWIRRVRARACTSGDPLRAREERERLAKPWHKR